MPGHVTDREHISVQLFLSGGYHDDPLHRLRLRAGMEFLRKTYGDPTFIAVEANRTLFQAVILWQRQHFVHLAKKLNTKLSKIRVDHLESLAKTIYYEADSHECLFAHRPEVIWLDDQRSFGTSDDPCGTAERYFKTCCEALENESPGRNIKNAMQAISCFVTARAAQSPENDSFDRDRAWAKMIRRKSTHQPGYGIVAVGENHIQNRGSYLGALLAANGFRCELRHLANATTVLDTWST